MILEPNTPSSLDFSINNPSDTATYYIQAVVRAVVANKVIGTYNLSLITGQYYRAPWTTPVDNSGVGYEIVIIFSVYTDAAYTQLSAIYGATMQKYVVRHLASQNLGGFTRGGQEGVDYKKLEKLIRSIISELPPPKELEAYDDMPVMQSLHELRALVEDMDSRSDRGNALAENRQSELLQTIAGHVIDLKGHISKEVGGAKTAIASHDAQDDRRHAESISAHEATHEGIKTLGEDHEEQAGHHQETLDKMDEVGEELGKHVDTPLTLTFARDKGKKEPSKKENAENDKNMTVQKLIEMSSQSE